MNNSDQQQNDVDEPGTDPWLAMITEHMQRPWFTPEQLPLLWLQITPTGGTAVDEHRRDRWLKGAAVLYRRCETYPQHTKLAVVLTGLPPAAWYNLSWVGQQADDLLMRATPEQLRQALEHEQQQPCGSWMVASQIMTQAAVEQLTGPVIEQLPWNSQVMAWAAALEAGTPDPGYRARHIVEHIQQRLLGGDMNAWTVFLGIIDEGAPIGEPAELAVAVARQKRPFLNGT